MPYKAKEMMHDNPTVGTTQDVEQEDIAAPGSGTVLDQQAELSAIMLFNADKRFSITE
ncbi:hypothetical protein [Flavobacterium akiainvivens]|uniref:hypothetical protein n=1 Tax=Flavobacterium akiainvivens TaxID=1202724 RepID=UPI001364A03C|nr:hypothetical protein [Flavobacterium akiainvivens]